jgi:hypothetical protein
MRCIT